MLMMFSFNMVTHISTGISLIACLLVAVCGYVVFTDKTEVCDLLRLQGINANL